MSRPPHRVVNGERLLTLAFGLFGVVWVYKALQLSYWTDFAPSSGFLPFWVGALIVVLSAVVLWQSFRTVAEPAEQEGPPGQAQPWRVVAIVAGLVACIGVLPYLGFVVSVAAYLIYLIGWVERRGTLETLAISIGVSAGMWGIFKAWLSVPLPRGPWGF